MHFSGPAASGSSRFGPIKTSFSCLFLGGNIYGNGGFRRETDGFWGTTTLRSSKAAKTKMQPTSSEGRNATAPWNASVMFRDGNLDFEAYGYHMDIIWISYDIWILNDIE